MSTPIEMKTLQNLKFTEMLFNAAQLSDALGISRTTLHQYEKQGSVTPSEYKIGATMKKLFSWEDHKKVVQTLGSKIKKPSKKTRVFSNLKGGVGKSSLASQFAMSAAASGVKTIILDLDPQAHVTSSILGYDPNGFEDYKTLFDVIVSGTPVKEAIITPLAGSDMLSIIPANLSFSALERRLGDMKRREYQILKIVEQIESDYDLIVIDTNPAPSMVNINAFIAADELELVTITDFMSVSGLKTMFDLLSELSTDLPDDFIASVRIIPNLFDVREAISQEALGQLRKNYNEYTINTVVHRNVDIREAQKRGQAIWQYNKKSVGADDILSLTKEILYSQEASNSKTKASAIVESLKD